MNYSQIKEAALKYSMRTDQDTADRVDDFFRIVEARLNRLLNTQRLSARSVLTLTEGTYYYAIPVELITLRDIQINHAGGGVSTPVYVNPETMNEKASTGSSEYVYTLTENQIQISPVADGDQMELVYMKQIPRLTSSEPYNPISNKAPDIYIFGLLVEISAYSKDYEASHMWSQRFSNAVDELQKDDDISRWAGTPLRIRTA